MGNANIGIAVYWPHSPWVDSHPTGPKRWLSFYIFAMQAFGADTLILIHAPVVTHGYHIEYEQHNSIEDVLAAYPDHTYVSMTGKAQQALSDFEHPEENVIYLMGNDYSDIPDVDGPKVRIDNYKDSNLLWSHNCASIVLYDRYLKELKNGGNQ